MYLLIIFTILSCITHNQCNTTCVVDSINSGWAELEIVCNKTTFMVVTKVPENIKFTEGDKCPPHIMKMEE